MMAGKTQISSSDDDGKEKQLMELPVDTLVYILLKLPAKSVGCIKCVSKTLLNMVNNTSFSTLHTRSLTAPNSAAAADQVPRLMCCTGDYSFVTLHSLKYNCKDHTLTKGRYAVSVSSFALGCPHFVFCNLFCLGYDKGDLMLINPLGERGALRLPENSFARPKRNSWLGMGFDDKTNTYKIVCVSNDSEACLNSMSVHVLVLGTNSWRQISSLPPPRVFSLSHIELQPVCANGAVHWWATVDRKIVSFDLRREEFCCIPTPPTLQVSNRDSYLSMFTLRGCLAIVETKGSPRSMEIWVLKDFDEKRWVRYYYNNRLPDDFPIAGYPREWEHGVFFTAYTFINYIDIRTGSINRVVHDEHIVEGNGSYTALLGIYSYSDTLISLKDYGNLEEKLMIEMMT